MQRYINRWSPIVTRRGVSKRTIGCQHRHAEAIVRFVCRGIGFNKRDMPHLIVPAADIAWLQRTQTDFKGVALIFIGMGCLAGS